MGICLAMKEIRNRVREKLLSEKFQGAQRMKETDFTRKRKLGFAEIFVVVVKGAKRGLRVAVKEVAESVRFEVKDYTEMAFCKARRKINWTAFAEISELTAQAFYDAARRARRWRGLRVWGIDGSKVNLPTNPETLAEFGSENYPGGPRAQGLASCLYDALNAVTLHAVLDRFDASERDLAAEHLRKLERFCKEQGTNPSLELLTMDRGYPSEGLIRQAMEAGFSFVFRVNRRHFWKELRRLNGPDCLIQHGGMTLRAVTIPLKEPEKTRSGEIVREATFLTNLPAEEYSVEDIAELYALRWRSEVHYGFLKSRVELENFTGLSPLCVRQDFHAAIVLSNLIAASFYDASLCAERYSEGKKWEYKPNYAETYRELRRNVFDLILSRSEWAYRRAYGKLQKEIAKSLIPVRNDRHPQRGKPRRTPRFFHNHKPS